MVFSPKLLVGGVTLAGTGVGLGGVILTSRGSSTKTISATKDVVQVEEILPIKKGCRLHTLESEANGTFKSISKEELKRKINQGKESDYQKIEDECKNEKWEDKDIFVSNKSNSGWKFYKEDQEKSGLKEKFQNYLKGINRQ